MDHWNYSFRKLSEGSRVHDSQPVPWNPPSIWRDTKWHSTGQAMFLGSIFASFQKWNRQIIPWYLTTRRVRSFDFARRFPPLCAQDDAVMVVIFHYVLVLDSSMLHLFSAGEIKKISPALEPWGNRVTFRKLHPPSPPSISFDALILYSSPRGTLLSYCCEEVAPPNHRYCFGSGAPSEQKWNSPFSDKV